MPKLDNSLRIRDRLLQHGIPRQFHYVMQYNSYAPCNAIDKRRGIVMQGNITWLTLRITRPGIVMQAWHCNAGQHYMANSPYHAAWHCNAGQLTRPGIVMQGNITWLTLRITVPGIVRYIVCKLSILSDQLGIVHPPLHCRCIVCKLCISFNKRS
jgi:hypothetical protein